MLIVQHVRERDHPFNTARMVHRALAKSKLVFGTQKSLREKELPIAPGAGLLFPSSDSIELGELTAGQQPTQLVVIDGTWSQAKTLLRALPQLRSLPRYKLAPTKPGQYRIRLEPTDTSLSTVEATVAALKALEPETEELGQLQVAFEVMVQKQLDHPKVDEQHYASGPNDGTTFNVPNDLFVAPNRIVVAYGEASFREESEPRNVERTPVVWCAQNLGTGERFFTTLQTETHLPNSFLKHLELSRADFDGASDMGEFLNRWHRFVQSAEVLVAYNEGTLKLLNKANQLAGHLDSTPDQQQEICKRPSPRVSANNRVSTNLKCVTLKSINFKASADSQSGKMPQLTTSAETEAATIAKLDDKVQAGGDPLQVPGRAGTRLANIVSIVKVLREHQDDLDC